MHRPGTLDPIARVATAGSLALTAAFASVGTVGAYPAPASTATITSTCANVAPGGSCTVTYTLLNGSSQPVSGAPVTFNLSGLSTASGGTSATTNGSGQATITVTMGAAPLVGSDADCGKTGTVNGTSGAAAAQTTFTVNCAGSGGLLGILHNTLGSLLTNLTGGILSGLLGGNGYTLTVPQGSLPTGTTVGFSGPTGADLTALDGLLSSGESLLAAFEIVWPNGTSASNPLTLTIHNAAFHSGDHVYKIVNNALQLYPNSSVGEGVATITFSNDPTFAVVAPTTSTPSGLGNEGAQPPASNGAPTVLYAGLAGGLLVVALLAAPVMRRRREQV